jgi:hypothetical protein
MFGKNILVFIKKILLNALTFEYQNDNIIEEYVSINLEIFKISGDL